MEGSEPACIDYVVSGAGWLPTGPCELRDLICNDVNFAVTQSVFDGFYQNARFAPSLYQQALVEAGFHGRKTGRGFYLYGEESTKSPPPFEAPQPPPKEVRLAGGDFLTKGVLARLQEAFPAAGGIEKTQSDDLRALADQATVRLTDGRTAAQVAFEENEPDSVIVDLACDYESVWVLAMASGPRCSRRAHQSAVGLFQAAGYRVVTFDDVPGLVLMRTVGMLINEAAEAALQQVASCADIDLAMQKGTRYPAGPFQWSRTIGLQRINRVLRNLLACYGDERYPTVPLIQPSLCEEDNVDEK